MNEGMQTRRDARRGMWLVLCGGVVGWAFVIAAHLSDLTIDAGHSADALVSDPAIAPVRPSLYLIFAAIAVFTLSGLWGRRTALRAGRSAQSRLARPVARFAGTVIIIGLVLAACAAVFVFLDNFFDGGGDDAALARVFNSYLPIILYTALVIVAILAGFVFTVPAATSTATSPDPDSAGAGAGAGAAAPAAATSPVAATPPGVSSSPAAVAATTTSDAQPNRHVALAYAVPIVAVMVALVLGLIVADITGTAIEAWMWVIVQAIIAGGIVAGTVYAARALRSGAPDAGPGAGARILNFILSVVFAVAVSCMALGYGSSAVNQLRVQSSMSLDAYSEDQSGRMTGVDPEHIHISASGYDFARGSDGVLTLDPNGNALQTERADGSGAFWINASLPENLTPGAYTLTLTAVTVDDVTRTITSEFVVTDDGLIDLPETTYAASEADEMRVIAPTASWVLSDLLPALILLLLVIGMLSLTLQARHRDSLDR